MTRKSFIKRRKSFIKTTLIFFYLKKLKNIRYTMNKIVYYVILIKISKNNKFFPATAYMLTVHFFFLFDEGDSISIYVLPWRHTLVKYCSQ